MSGISTNFTVTTDATTGITTIKPEIKTEGEAYASPYIKTLPNGDLYIGYIGKIKGDGTTGLPKEQVAQIIKKQDIGAKGVEIIGGATLGPIKFLGADGKTVNPNQTLTATGTEGDDVFVVNGDIGDTVLNINAAKGNDKVIYESNAKGGKNTTIDFGEGTDELVTVSGSKFTASLKGPGAEKTSSIGRYTYISEK